jgi:folate-dependent phosphoribosylglycinamide formyltransferase PurN
LEALMLTPLYDPANGPMRVVGLMSGSGSNLRRILEHEQRLAATPEGCPFTVVAIFSDRADSQAAAIGADFDRPVVIRDLRAFYHARNKSRRDLELRAEYDRQTVVALAPYRATVAAFAGYMSIATRPLIDAFVGVNVHPADLAVEREGRRVYVGDHAVRDAIVDGCTHIHATTHLIEPVVDGGRLLMISEPVAVDIPENLSLERKDDLRAIEDHNQERLKEGGDWRIFPATLDALARGDFAADEQGRLHYQGAPIPKGLRM